MQKMMRITFKDGRPDCIVPYSTQNHAQYSKILANEIKEIELVEEKKKLEIIQPPKPPVDVILRDEEGNAKRQTLTEADIDALVAKKLQEQLAKLQLPVTEIVPITDENAVSEWEESGLSKKAFADKTGYPYHKLIKFCKEVGK